MTQAMREAERVLQHMIATSGLAAHIPPPAQLGQRQAGYARTLEMIARLLRR